MLHLLIGRSGSGKTRYILERLREQIAAGQRKIIWLVPEQHSFESERMLLHDLGVQDAALVQVLSFSRLADRVFREVGGMAKERLDEGSRALLMSRALDQVAAVSRDLDEPMQGIRTRQAADSAYMQQLLSLWEELKQCCVDTEELETAAQQLEQEDTERTVLPEKLRDLYRVFSAYEGLAADSGLDELEELTQLAEVLPDSSLPDGACLYVDGFKGFTAQEMAVLEQLMQRAGDMTVSLCTDTPGVRWPGTEKAACRREYTLFSPVTDTVDALRRLAARHALHWEMTCLEENRRTESGALQALERGLYAPAPEVYTAPAPEVTVIPCEDEYEECTVAVREIRRLMREECYRCRDITVAVRDLPTYQGLLDTALEQEGIPYYMDTRTDLLCEPLVVYIRAALRLVVGGWRTEELLRLMKTDLTPLSPVEIAQVENYVYLWQIEGSSWELEWTENPDGLGKEMTAARRRRLDTLNRCRAQVMEPLCALRRQWRGSVTGRQFASGLYAFLSEDKDLPQRIARQVEVLEEMAQPVLAAHAARLWDEVMGILDRFALALGEQTCALSRLEELFTMLCQLVDMGHIPQGLDAVTVGSADRIRYNHPRAVLVLGANEGVFPAYPAGNGLLTEEERHTLQEQGVTLSADLLRQCVEERYYVYMAVAAPSERLTVLYRNAGDMAPSPLVGAIDRILPAHGQRAARQEDGRELESRREMFQRLAENYELPGPVTASLAQVLGEQPNYQRRLDSLYRAAARLPFRIEQPKVARRLFGTDMCLSSSQTEKFYTCRFAYFCRYGLRIEPRPRAQVDSALFGTVVHYVMEVLLQKYTAEDGRIAQLKAQCQAAGTEELDAEAARKLMKDIAGDVHQVIAAYVKEKMSGAEEKTGRFLYQMGLAERSAVNMLWHTVMELVQSAFQPVGFELAIYPEGEEKEGGVLSLRLPFAGGSVQMRGKVDRVDLFVRFDGTAFVRVVDYKTGTKKFNLSELTAGINMQMLVYLFTLCSNGQALLAQEEPLRPAGVLYHPLSDLIVNRGEDADRRLKSMQMNGLVLDDASVVHAMEPLGRECYIPASIDKGGKPKGSVISTQQFALLQGVIEQLLVGMAQHLQAGDIEAWPLQKDDRLSCTYCDYRAVCGHEDTDRVHLLDKRSDSKVWEELEQQADGEVCDGE